MSTQDLGQTGIESSSSYNHLLHLLADHGALDDLDVLHARQDLVLDFKAGFHAEDGAFFDGEGFIFEGLEGAGGGEVDDDVGAVLDLWE